MIHTSPRSYHHEIAHNFLAQPQKFLAQLEIQAFAGLHTNVKLYINYYLYKMASLLALMNRAVSYFTESSSEMNSKVSTDNEMNNSEMSNEVSTDDEMNCEISTDEIIP
jgi:hypothetical protein